MPVLRQDLLRSTFQQSQIELLKRLDKNIESSTRYMKDTEEFLDATLLNSIDSMFRNLATAINKKVDYVSGELQRRQSEERINDDTNAGRQEEVTRRGFRDLLFSQEKSTKRITETLSRLADEVGLSVQAVINNTMAYSDAYNTLLKNTGLSGEDVRELRGSILDTVKELNSQYGSIFSSVESVQLMTTLANTGVRDPDYFEEFADELLEAAKVTNIDLGILAKFSDRFYRKYNFTSEDMNSLLNDLNTNLRGSTLSEEQLMAHLEDNEFLINKYLYNQGIGLTSEEASLIREDISKNLNAGLSYATDIEAVPVLEQLKTALERGRTSEEAIGISAYSGISFDELSSRYYTDLSGLLYDIIVGYQNNGIVQSYLTSEVGSEYSNYRGFDEEVMKAAFSTNLLTPEESLERRGAGDPNGDGDPTIPTIEDQLNDYFMTQEDRMANALEQVYGDYFAEFQETTGMNVTIIKDCFMILLGFLGLMGGGGGLSKLLGKGGPLLSSFGSLLGGSSSATGLLATVGPIAAAVAAVGVTALGISEGIQEIKDIRKDFYDRMAPKELPELGEGEVYTYGVTGSYLDEDGKIHNEYGLVSGDSYTAEDKSNMLNDELSRVESSTGLNTYTDSDSFLDYAKKTAVDTFRGLVGTGWWQDDAKWYDYIPMISGITSGVERFYGNDIVVPNSVDTMDSLIKYLNEATPEERNLYTLYNSLGLINQGSKNYEETLEAFFKNADKLLDLYNHKKGQYVIDPLNKQLNDYAKVSELIGRGEAIPLDSLTSSTREGGGGEASESHDAGRQLVPGYDTGTNYVPYDQLAYIHEGEAITPAEYNPAANLNELERLKSKEREAQENTLSSMKEMNTVLKSIKEFLEYWRSDNINREMLESIKAQSAYRDANLRLEARGGY